MPITIILRIIATAVMATGTVIIDFSEEDPGSWRAVNDVVMGGRSRSGFEITSDSTGVFKGFLSLENSGGFASVRRESPLQDLSAFEGLELRLSGDGRRYQLRLRMDSRFDGIAYRFDFDTARDSVVTVKAPFDEFVPTFRGRTVISAPPLDPDRITRLGFLIADGKEGPFRLEIFNVVAYISGDE